MRNEVSRSGRSGVRVLMSCVAVAAALCGCAAQKAFEDGERLAASGRPQAALEKFSEALAEEPNNASYRNAAIKARARVVDEEMREASRALPGDPEAALQHYRRVLATEPNHALALEGVRAVERASRHQQWLTEARELANRDPSLAKLRLAALLREDPRNKDAAQLLAVLPEGESSERALADTYRKPISIELRDVTLKQLFDAISQASGLSFVFDKDVKLDTKASMLLKSSTVEAALYYVLLTQQLEQQVMNPHTLLVYPNNGNKQKEYQQTVVRTFQLQHASAKIVAESLRTLLKLKDFVVDEKLNLLMLRESPDMVRLAERVIAAQDISQPEVMLDVEVLEVSRDRLRELGIQLPTGVSLAPLAATTSKQVTLEDLRGLNSSRIAASIDPLKVNARGVDSAANILANPRIRVVNNEKAKVTVGNRVPSFTSSIVAATVPVTSETVTYIDIGLKLEVEPTIYANGDVAIRVGLEVTNIVDKQVSKNGTLAYTIGNRTAQTVLRLKDGENQVLAGLINDEDRKTLNKLPGLADLPLVGRLFGSQLDDRRKSEIVLSITPRLVRPTTVQGAELSEFDSGTESSLRRPPARSPTLLRLEQESRGDASKGEAK